MQAILISKSIPIMQWANTVPISVLNAVTNYQEVNKVVIKEEIYIKIKINIVILTFNRLATNWSQDSCFTDMTQILRT